MSVQINDIADYANIVACVITTQKDRNSAWQSSLNNWLEVMRDINNNIIEAYNMRYGHEDDNPIPHDDLIEFRRAWQKYDDIDNYDYRESLEKAYHDIKIIKCNLDGGPLLHRALFNAFEKVIEKILLKNNMELYYV